MSSSAFTRHIALAITLTLALVAFPVASSHAGSSSGSSTPWSNWLPASEGDDGGCGSDGDPDNPTVDRPRASDGSTDVVLIGSPSDEPLERVLWEVWLSRLLQLMGIR